jgi:hypothetical protein
MVLISDFHLIPTGSPQVGTITQWEDGKGYGWVSYGGKQLKRWSERKSGTS